MFNKRAFKAKMALAGYNQKELSKEIGVSEQLLTRRLKTGVFRSDEIERICPVLHIEDPAQIFFCSNGVPAHWEHPDVEVDQRTPDCFLPVRPERKDSFFKNRP